MDAYNVDPLIKLIYDGEYSNQRKNAPGSEPGAFPFHRVLKSLTTLDDAHLSCGWPFLTLLNYKLNPLPFAEALETVRFDGRMMHKDILLTPVSFDKSEPFAITEPLNGACLTFTHGKKLL